MEFTDYFLKADSEEALRNALTAANMLDKENILIDVIGVIWERTGQTVTLEDNTVGPEFAPIPGFHANVRVLGELTSEQQSLLPIIPKPTVPKRFWA